MTQKMPQSLCPYFWKLAIMWVFIVPYTVITLPIVVLKYESRNSTSERAALGMLLWLFLFVAFSMVSLIGIFWIDPEKNPTFRGLFIAGIVGWVVAAVFGVVGLIHWLKDKWESRHIRYDENGYRIYTDPVKQDSILVSFVKAKYNKYCPKINWKYDE